MKSEKTLSATVDELLRQLGIAYTEAVSTLDKERLDLEGESQGILKAADELRLLLPAKARVAERAADDLLLKGKHEEAQAKRDEQRQAERAPAEMEERRRAISERVTGIGNEKRTIARRVLAEWFPLFRLVLLAEQRALVDGMDAAWAGMQAFDRDTAAPGERFALVTPRFRDDMWARNLGEEKELFERIYDWFQFRGKAA
jgi:hypothetical protein